jgi:hypothetical protein
LRKEFESLRLTYYNPVLKGHGYEDVLREFLQTYLGDVFKFYSRVALIDTNHEILQLLKLAQNAVSTVYFARVFCPIDVSMRLSLTDSSTY